MNRRAKVKRKTLETSIKVEIDLDGAGNSNILTPVGFFNHMLQSLTRHSGMDLKLEAKGDVEVDFHHLVEDAGIAIGEAVKKALGDKRGIARFGEATVPMDEALVQVVLDLSGRDTLSFSVSFPAYKVGEFDTELVKEFFQGLVRGAALTLHIRLLESGNTHHVIEAIFKACGLALRRATRLAEEGGSVPSTKGML